YLPSSTGQPSGAKANQPNPGREAPAAAPLPVRVHVPCARPHLPASSSCLLPPSACDSAACNSQNQQIPKGQRAKAKAPKGKMVSSGRHRKDEPQQPSCPTPHSTAGDAMKAERIRR
ncbi:hypothetical protein PVAP13_6NG147103, partial [Panicum virgatum]